MSFQWPLVLLALLLIPAMVGGYIVYRRRVARHAVPFSDVDVLVAAAQRPRLRTYLPVGLALLSVGTFIFAAARPEADRAVPREQATIMLAIDVSGSMAADDVEPFRLRAAQDAAIAFAEKVPRQYRIGLVSFSEGATTLVAPTTDRQAFTAAVETLHAEGATAIGEAIYASLDAIQSVQPNRDGKLDGARILLLSDGDNTTGRSTQSAVEAANQLGVPVATVALGTQDGVLPNGRRVPPNPEALGQIAEATGAKMYEATDAEGLSAVYERMGSVIGTVTVKDEVTAIPAGIGVLLLFLAGAAAWRFGSRFP